MLGLRTATDPRWLEAARADLPRLLSDHAHCELKAAQSALSVVARFGGEHPSLVAPLTALAQEEARHFEEVHAQLADRGDRFEPPARDDYVGALRDAARALPWRPLLLDRLLVSALIEARSCERFKLLADGLDDDRLSPFYRELMASEARHHRLFRDLARDAFGEPAARERLDQLAVAEADVVATLPIDATVHG